MVGVLVADYVLLTWFDLDRCLYGMGIVLGALGVAHLAAPIRAPGASRP